MASDPEVGAVPNTQGVDDDVTEHKDARKGDELNAKGVDDGLEGVEEKGFADDCPKELVEIGATKTDESNLGVLDALKSAGAKAGIWEAD